MKMPMSHAQNIKWTTATAKDKFNRRVFDITFLREGKNPELTMKQLIKRTLIGVE